MPTRISGETNASDISSRTNAPSISWGVMSSWNHCYIIEDKQCSILVIYFVHMRLDVNGSIFCTKDEKIDFEENKFNVRFGECSVFDVKRPINVESYV